jgi:competence protein ComEA
MKEIMIMVCIITLVLMIIFFPKPKTYTFVTHEKEDMYTYTVTIEGAVYQPGSYTFFESLTLREIIQLSTYVKDDADLDQLNLEKRYDSNTTIYIPSKEQEIPNYERININEANFQTLLEIPGMQERQAASIIIYREAHGLFASIEELIHVKYIGAATLEKLKPYITT